MPLRQSSAQNLHAGLPSNVSTEPVGRTLDWMGRRSSVQYSTDGMTLGITAATGIPRSSSSSSRKKLGHTSRSSTVLFPSPTVQTPRTFEAPLAVEPTGSDGDGVSLGPSCGHAVLVTGLFNNGGFNCLVPRVLLALCYASGRFW